MNLIAINQELVDTNTINDVSQKSLENLGKVIPQENPDKANFIFVKVGSSIVKVCYNEITYVEGLKDYVKIHVGNKKNHITKCTVKHIESRLPNNIFSRIHKSYIVSIGKIDKIEFNHTFIGGKQLPIGMQFKKSFNDLIDQYRL